MGKTVLLYLPSRDGKPKPPWIDDIEQPPGVDSVQVLSHGASLLCFNFNIGYGTALENAHIDYFAMLHDDIIPQPDWLSVLMHEMRTYNADVMSAVVPLREETGITSTAWADPAQPFLGLRRLTMKEVFTYPETFGTEHVPEGKILIVNSGCMLIDLRKPWVHRRTPDGYLKVRFHERDEILVCEDGSYMAVVGSEDWNFSRDVQAEGGKVYATRKVRLGHAIGGIVTNDHAWGDEVDAKTADVR